MLVNMCKGLGFSGYISPQGSAEYINESRNGGAFAENGIALYYHNYEHPAYKQLYGNFLPFMSIIDILFNEGFDNALDIIRSGRRQPIYYEDFRGENFKRF